VITLTVVPDTEQPVEPAALKETVPAPGVTVAVAGPVLPEDTLVGRVTEIVGVALFSVTEKGALVAAK